MYRAVDLYDAFCMLNRCTAIFIFQWVQINAATTPTWSNLQYTGPPMEIWLQAFFLLGIVTIALVKITQTTQSNLLTTRSKKLHQISYWQVGERLFITATTGHLSSVKWPWSKQCNKRENKQVTYRSCTTSKHGYHKIFDLLQNQVRLSW